MVQIVPPAGWDANAGLPLAEQPGMIGDPALSISTTASVIIPAGATADLSNVAARLEAPAVDVPVGVAPSLVLTPAEASSPVLLWALGGVAAVSLLGGLAWAVWPEGEKAVEAALPAIATKDREAAAEPSSDLKPVKPSAEQPVSTPSKPSVASNTKDGPTQAVQPASIQPGAKAAAAESRPVETKPSEPIVPALPQVEPKTANLVDPPKAAVVESAPSNGASAPDKAAAPQASAPDHSPVLKFDPLDFDPDRLGASAKAASDAKGSTSSIPDKPPVDATVAEAAGSETGATRPLPAPRAEAVAGNVEPPHIANSSITARRGQAGDAPQQAFAQRLAARVKSFQVADMPLVGFVDTLSGIAGTGITLDPIALEQVGISPQATVSVNAEDAPLQAILHDGLAQRRLDIAEQGGRLRVVLPKAHEPHAIDYDVEDLVAEKDAAPVGQLIERFVAPATWKSVGGTGTVQVNGTTLHIEQSDAIRREIVIFCERLRLARSLAVRSKYPAAMLSVESPYQRLSAKFGEHTTFTFLPWTRLADVVRNWQELSGILVLVDWGALADVELGPSSHVACSVNDRSWLESLDGVLEPLGLGWWGVNGETIQITSLAALEKIQRIEFYPVPAKLRSSLASNQALVDTLQKELAESAGKQGKPAPVHMEVDEPSGRLIVLASPNVHRQLSRRLAGEAKP